MRNVCIACYSYFMATENLKSAKVTRFEEFYNSIQSEADQPCIGTVRSFMKSKTNGNPYISSITNSRELFSTLWTAQKRKWSGEGGRLICKGWSCDASFERLIKILIRLLSYLYFCDALKWVGFGFVVPLSAYITISDFIFIVDNCRRGSV